MKFRTTAMSRACAGLSLCALLGCGGSEPADDVSATALHQEAPSVSMRGTLAAAPIPARVMPYDFDGDGKEDLLWSEAGAEGYLVQLSNAASTTGVVAPAVMRDDPSAWFYGAQIAGSGDFNGDGRADVVLHYWISPKQPAEIWLMNGAAPATRIALPLSRDNEERPIAVADFNGDGRPDILVQGRMGEAATLGSCGFEGYLDIWIMDGTQVAARERVFDNRKRDSEWLKEKFLTVADWDGDGKSDILTARKLDHDKIYWLRMMDGTRVRESKAFTTPGQVTALADFNGDGQQDLLLNGRWTSWSPRPERWAASIWLMHHGELQAWRDILPAQALSNTAMVSTADLDGNGTADILWETRQDPIFWIPRQFTVWLMDGVWTKATQRILDVNEVYEVPGIFRRQGLGGPVDLVWRHGPLSEHFGGHYTAWTMAGATTLNATPLARNSARSLMVYARPGQIENRVDCWFPEWPNIDGSSRIKPLDAAGENP